MSVTDIINNIDPVIAMIVLVNVVMVVAIIKTIKMIMARDELEQKDNSNRNEKILDAFIKDQEYLARAGSGDDEVYTNQISKYVNKQRKLWLTLIEELNKRNSI